MLDPFSGLQQQGKINRLDEIFGMVQRTDGRPTGAWAPAVDVTAEGGHMVIRAELPGVEREDVNVSLSRGVLTISGERKEEEEREDKGYLIRERRSGAFRRSTTLPEGVDESKVKARFEDGVLVVTIEGGATAVQDSPKRIDIEG